MAKSRLTIGIELAGEEMRLAVLENAEADPAGHTLHTARTVHSAEELTRVLRALPRRPAAVVCAIPLEKAAVRILSLPPTTEDNLDRVVALEAESAMPLSGEELALSHHVLGMNEQSRLEVLVAAARLTTVQEALRRVNCMPWLSAQVTVTAASLVSLIQTLPSSERDDTCAVLRIERDSSELLVLERGKVVTTQFFSAGCGEAHAAAEAERTPVGAGVASSGGAAIATAPSSLTAPGWIASVAQPVRFALQALSYERGLTVQRLYLCGEGATRSGAEWHLADRLDLTPTILGAPAAASTGDGGESGLFAVAYGCALQAAGAAVISLNLTPARVTVAREIEQRRQTRISWGALAGAAVAAVGLVFAGAVSQQNRKLAYLDQQLAERRGISAAALMSPADLKAADEAVQAQAAARVPAAHLIATLSRQLPEGTWLAELSYNAGTGSVIRGYSLHPSGPQRAVIALLRQRRENKPLFDEVTLDYQTEEAINSVPVWGFQMTCRLRPEEVKRSRRRSTRTGARQ